VPQLPGSPSRRADEPVGIVLAVAGFGVLTTDSPSNGDVLITTERGRHLLSVVPHPHRLSLSEYTLALQIARKWAQANKAAVWRTNDGVFTKLSHD
jgi:hypothetical protein